MTEDGPPIATVDRFDDERAPMTHTTARAMAAAIAAALVLLGLPFTATASSEYPPQECVLSISNPAPGPGETFTVTAFSNDEGGMITFTFNGETKTATVVNGQATVSFVGPPPGSYMGTVECDGATTDFEVSVPTPNIPPTGSDSSGSGLKIGVGLVGLGGAMLVVAHRRRKDEPAGTSPFRSSPDLRRDALRLAVNRTTPTRETAAG